MKIGFKTITSDPCVDIYSEDGVIVTLNLYVDDVLLFGKDVMMLKQTKQKMMNRCSMADMGEVSLVLGMGVTRGHH